MAVEPFDWNVVVVGYWNPAILTPSGIARRLFELPKGTPVMVEVPMDGLAPHRVRHDGVIVTAEPSRLTLTTEDPTLGNIERAKCIAARAINALPETPLTAAGFNLRLKVDDVPERLLEDTAAKLDALLSDAGFRITARVLQRSLEYGEGSLNLDVRQAADGEVRVGLNFHRQSSAIQDLCGWLEMPLDAIQKAFSRVLGTVGLSFQEAWR